MPNRIRYFLPFPHGLIKLGKNKKVALKTHRKDKKLAFGVEKNVLGYFDCRSVLSLSFFIHLCIRPSVSSFVR